MARGLATLAGVIGAGALLWTAAWMRDDDRGEYWAAAGLYAAAGLVLAVSQIVGGWTKWGWPRVSPEVLVLGFAPALVIGGWAIGAHEPSGWFADNLPGWADDVGFGWLVSELTEAVPALALGIGLVFGFTLDTSGPARPRPLAPVERDVRPEPVDATGSTSEPAPREPERVP